MKPPSICPKCHGPLVNTLLNGRGMSVWKKACETKLNHGFICLVREKDSVILGIGIMLNRQTSLKAFWDFVKNRVLVHKSEMYVPFPADNALQIPWFEPNIDEYNKLIDKVKKYITFS